MNLYPRLVMNEVHCDVRSSEMLPYPSGWLTIEHAAFKSAFDDALTKRTSVQQCRAISRASLSRLK